VKGGFSRHYLLDAPGGSTLLIDVIDIPGGMTPQSYLPIATPVIESMRFGA
jgi:hypothetical protein